MVRAIYALLLAAIVGLGVLGTFGTPASASGCEIGTRSVNCDSAEEADQFMSENCAGGGDNIECPGVGTKCGLQDDGILCEAGEVPSGGVPAGGGGTAGHDGLVLWGAGTAVLAAGVGYALYLRRRRTAEP